MKDKKIYIGIIIFMLLFAVVLFITFDKNIEDSIRNVTLITEEGSIWEYNEDSWHNKTNTTSFDVYSWKNYDIYDNGEKIGNYKLVYDEKWHVYNEQIELVHYEGPMVAIKSDKEVAVKKFTATKIDDLSILEKELLKSDITNYELTTNQQIKIDLDSDGKEETLYIASNAFSEIDQEKAFAKVLMEKENTIYELYSTVEKNDGYDGTIPYISSILDVNGDGIYEIILTCGKYSIEESTQMLYQFDGKDFKILVSNQ